MRPTLAIGVLPAARLLRDGAMAVRESLDIAAEEIQAFENMGHDRSLSAGIRRVAAGVEVPVQGDDELSSGDVFRERGGNEIYRGVYLIGQTGARHPLRVGDFGRDDDGM